MEQAFDFRLRPDLEAFRQRRGHQTTWVLKDPLTLEYVEVQDFEYRAVQLLDGRRSLKQILMELSEFQRETPVTLREFESFLLRLSHSGLLLRDAAGEGLRLYRERLRESRRARAMRIFNFVAIRVRGIDPDPWLTRTLQHASWLFSPGFVAAGGAMILAALALVLVEFPQLEANLPALRTFATPGNLVWLAVAVALTKILHELGHALVCKRLGGECHDMGLLFLVFAPCLYCDVSDSWTMSRRSHRMAISAAGIFVDMVSASVCTWLWWLTNPGWLHTLCLNVMLICSINTLLFNGNPFLRYDGYFILSDLVGIPNLMQRAFSTLRRMLSQLCLGIGQPDTVGLQGWKLPFVVIYGLAAIAYRCVLIAAIISVFYVILTPYGLEPVAGLAAILMVSGLFIGPVLSLAAFVRSGQLQSSTSRLRFALAIAIGTGAVLLVLYVPFGRSVSAPAILAPAAAQEVYVPEDARLIETLPAGAAVQAGDVIARLRVPRLEQQKLELQARHRTLEVEAQLLATLRERDARAAALLPTTRKKLDGVVRELQQLQHRERALTLRTAVNGQVLPPPVRRIKTPPGTLPTWSGTPLDARNLGTTLSGGTLFCLTGNPQHREARLAVAQEAVSALAVGQPVELLLEQHPGHVLSGQVSAISPLDLTETAADELRLWKLPFQFDARGKPILEGTYYEASVKLDAPAAVPATLRSPGKARIHVAAETLGQKVRRWFHRTFRW